MTPYPLLLHPSPPRCSYGCAGAMWDMWRWQDTPVLRQWLLAHCAAFTHRGRPVDAARVVDAIFDQCFMLNAQHLAQLKRDTGVRVPLLLLAQHTCGMEGNT